LAALTDFINSTKLVYESDIGADLITGDHLDVSSVLDFVIVLEQRVIRAIVITGFTGFFTNVEHWMRGLAEKVKHGKVFFHCILKPAAVYRREGEWLQKLGVQSIFTS
jgi:hypothetical protein